jgi:hypothetical protein
MSPLSLRNWTCQCSDTLFGRNPDRQVRQLAGLPLLPLRLGGTCTLTLAPSAGASGSNDAVFLASGDDAQLLVALAH